MKGPASQAVQAQTSTATSRASALHSRAEARGLGLLVNQRPQEVMPRTWPADWSLEKK